MKRFIQISGIFRLPPQLAFGGLFVLLGTMVSNVSAYAYHLFVGRILGPAKYGELLSIISILYLLGVMTLVLQTVFVKFFSISKAQNNISEARFLFFYFIKNIGIGLILFLFIAAGAAYPLSGFLHLASPRFIFWAYGIFALTSLFTINVSVLQGFQMFFWFGFFSAIPSVFRLVFSIPLSYYGIEWTMLASLFATFVSYVFCFYPIRFLFWSNAKKLQISKNQIIFYSIPTFFAVLGITSFYTMDIVFARHFLSSEDAGIYAAVTTLGKIIFYATSAVTLVIFPKIAERKEKKLPTRKLTLQGGGIISVVSLALAGMYAAFPHQISNALYGLSFIKAWKYLGSFAVFMSLFSLTYYVVMVCLAEGKKQIWIAPVVGAGLQLALLWRYHIDIPSIISVNSVVCAATLVATLITYAYGKTK